MANLEWDFGPYDRLSYPATLKVRGKVVGPAGSRKTVDGHRAIRPTVVRTGTCHQAGPRYLAGHEWFHIDRTPAVGGHIGQKSSCRKPKAPNRREGQQTGWDRRRAVGRSC